MHSEDRPSDRSTFKKRFQKGTATLKKAADTECSTERFCRHFVAIVETAPNSAGAHGSELKPSNGKNSSIPKIIRKRSHQSAAATGSMLQNEGAVHVAGSRWALHGE